MTNTNSQMTTTFATSTSGELTQVNYPYGGHLRWAYTNMTYTGSRTQREVQTRYLAMSSGSSELTYPLYHDSADSGRSLHYWTTLDDAGGQGEKAWIFQTDSSQPSFGLLIQLSERLLNPNRDTRSTTPFWTRDSLNRPYISSSYITLDGNTSNQAMSRTDQTLDQYGNVTSMTQYDFGLTNPRTYTNTYLTDSTGGHPSGSDYNAEHIHNRLLSSTVTQNGQTATLVNNSYDYYDPGQCGATHTPSGWSYVNSVTSIDPANTSNVFRGNVTTSVGLDMTHTMCYATTGAVVMRTDGGHTTTTSTSGQTNYTAPNAITTGSFTTSLNWASALALSNETDPSGAGMSIGYDSAGRPSSTTAPSGAVTSYTYSTSPPTTTATTTTSTSIPSDGRWTRTTMDGFGRTIKTEMADGSGTVQSVTDAVYAACGCSPLGKLSQKSMPHAPNAAVYWTVYTYDGLGRTLSVRAPDGASTTTYSYAGNTVTVTDPAGKWKKFWMDAFGNLTRVDEPDPQLGTVSTTYTYDALNHLASVAMPRNGYTQTRTFNYSGAYLTSATNPENGTVSYTYNADGRLASKTDAKGQTIQYLYDAYGRMTTVQHTNPTTVMRTYLYDTNFGDDPSYSQHAWGRLTRIQYNVAAIASPAFDNNNNEVDFTGDSVNEMYSYDTAGHVIGKRMRITRNATQGNSPTADLNASWTYDKEGRLTSVTYPCDPNVGGCPPAPTNYSYDGMGRLAGAQYNAAGQMTQWGSETRQYNSMGQLTNITASGLNITYNYPPAGQNSGKIASETDSLTGETVTYAYDSLNRLISAQAGSSWGQGFQYDGFGNLTAKTVLAGSVPTFSAAADPATNHYIGSSYDANGNPADPYYNSIAFDTENRLTISGTFRAAYDGQNKRIWACTTAGTGWWMPCTSPDTYYFYSPAGKLLAQFTPQYTVYTNTQKNNASMTMNGPTTTRTYFGSRLTGTEDRIGSRGKYFPYGEDRASTPANGQVGFATYTRDGASSYYADQRYFSNGRFFTPDPFPPRSKRDPGSWNRYSYAAGDPVNSNDPSGLLTLLINGAFDDSPDWLQSGSDFFNAVQATFGPITVWQWPGFGVTAVDLYIGIFAAGSALADYINKYSFQPGEQLNIVAFSDGGNVVKVASWSISHTIDNLVDLGTPQNWDLPGMNTSRVHNYCNVYSLADFVQVAGSSPYQLLNMAAAIEYALDAQWAAWMAFLADQLDDAAYYELLSSYYFADSYAWFLSTKIDPLAHNLELVGATHFDLHTAGVWNSIKGPCGLPK